MACCEKLNQTLAEKLPASYRFGLPTEAQWEFAARGGVNSRGYEYSGSNDIGVVAWYCVNSSDRTHEVGQKIPNELNIYDMTGNVCEWCHDWKGSYTSEAVTDPVGPTSGEFRVTRGGSWDFYIHGMKNGSRSCEYQANRSDGVGFRVALVHVQ